MAKALRNRPLTTQVKMRPAKQVKAISSQLEILDDLKTQLEKVLNYTNHAIQKGKSWIEESNDETFLGMNKFLTDETFESFRRCQDITKDINEESQQQLSLQEQDKKDKEIQSVTCLKTSKTPGFELKEEKKDQAGLLEKYQEMEKTISLQSKRLKQIEQKLQENETKDTMFRERKESENQYKMKFDELLEELDKTNYFMSSLQTQNEDVIKQVKEHDKQISSFIKTLHSVMEQIKENELKSETFMIQLKSTENSFSLRLGEVMKDTLGHTESISELKYDSETLYSLVKEQAKNFDITLPNLQEKLTDLAKQNAIIECACKKSEENNRSKLDEICMILESIDPKYKGKLKDFKKHIEIIERDIKEEEKNNRKKFDDVYKKIKSADLQKKILSVSSEVENLSKQLLLSPKKLWGLHSSNTTDLILRQQAFFFAKAEGAMNVQMNLRVGQIVTSFCLVLNNIGKYYDPTKGIFTAPCNGLYLCGLSLKCESGDDVMLGIIVKEASGTECKSGSIQTSTVKSNASLVAPLYLKQNEHVYIASRGDYTKIKLDIRSYFMCALISRT